MSLILINQWLRESSLRSRICITVHDSIVLDSPKDEVIEVAKKVKHIMENLGEYNEFYKFLGDMSQSSVKWRLVETMVCF